MLSRPARLLLTCLALVGAALAPAVLSAAPAGARADGARACANADLTPAPDNLPAIRAAILCLHNRDRAAYGLPALRENARLRRAAAGHTRDMLRRRYFAHDAPGGGGMADRIRATGYVDSANAWTLGENLAWGTGTRATPAEIEQAWMASAGHRANILRRSFREIGIGVAPGNPAASPASAGATYTADFGVRR